MASSQRLEIIRRTYYDSVTLMLVAKELLKLEGISVATLNMGTEANYKIMGAGGFDLTGVDATPNDLVLALLSDAPEAEKVLDDALAKAKEYLANPPGRKKDSGDNDYRPKSLDGALSVLPEANLAIVSVAGRYAGDVALQCIEKGLNVMLYSDNVTVEKEIEVKKAAAAKGLLVMGPDCGTIIIRGVAMGMANACPTGPVSIVAAAGTGLQEVHVQLARRGVGVLHGIGTGGRDVKKEVGGIMCLQAVEALLADDEVKVLAVLGKPPAPEVEKKILDAVKAGGKPAVLGFIGGEAKGDSDGVFVCRELEETAAVAAALANGQDGAAARDALYAEYDALKQQAEKIGKRKGYLRGLYSGGTLCYEGQLVARGILGPIWSNTPLDASKKLADSLKSVEHTMVDYGEDEFTQGRLHPMIDVSLRADRILEEAKDPGVGVILLDVVLGYGCNDDPATGLAEGIRKARKVAGERIAFVASICGVDTDPQNASRQRKILEELGVHVCESNARAARLAAMLVEVAQ